MDSYRTGSETAPLLSKAINDMGNYGALGCERERNLILAKTFDLGFQTLVSAIDVMKQEQQTFFKETIDAINKLNISKNECRDRDEQPLLANDGKYYFRNPSIKASTEKSSELAFTRIDEAESVIVFHNLFDACDFVCNWLKENSVKSFRPINGGASGWEIVYYA